MGFHLLLHRKTSQNLHRKNAPKKTALGINFTVIRKTYIGKILELLVISRVHGECHGHPGDTTEYRVILPVLYLVCDDEPQERSGEKSYCQLIWAGRSNKM